MHCIFFRYIIFRIFLVWKGLYVIKWPLGRNERDATLEILRSSETELPILKTKLPILGRQFQNKRTVRSMSLGRLKQAQFFCLVGIDIIIVAILFLDIQEILELCLARNVFYQEISGLHR